MCVFLFKGLVHIEPGAMVTATTALKAVCLFIAELLSSLTDWFQTKAAWAQLEVLENTELKTTGGSESASIQYYYYY